MRVLRLPAVTLLTLLAAGCGTELPPGESERGLDSTMTCPAGQVGWNFTDFPQPLLSSEGVSQMPDAGLPRGAPPSTMRVLEARCNPGTWHTGNMGENCDGRTRCIYPVDCPAGTTFDVHYECSGDTGSWKSNTTLPASKRMLLDISCKQPPPAHPWVTPTARKACVPLQCHGATRRNENLECVTDFSRPSATLADMQLTLPATGLKHVYVPRRTTSGWDLAVNPPYGVEYESYVAENLMIFPKGVYEMPNASLVYRPSTTGGSTGNLRGRVVLWLADVWGTSTSTAEVETFRCVMHSFEASKYPPGETLADGRRILTVDKERFVLPTDCTAESNALHYREVAAKKAGLTIDQFNARYRSRGIRLKTSFDLEGANITIPSGATKDTTCAPNPVDFFYAPAAKSHDLAPYYAQNAIPVRVGNSYTSTWTIGDINRTEVGLADVRLRNTEVRLRATGRLRGAIRADLDWYLAHDENGYWAQFGFDHFKTQLVARTYLVPKDASGNQIAAPAEGYTVVGEKRLLKADGLGATVSVRYPITDALRDKLLKAGSSIEVGATGRRTYELLTCVEIRETESGTLMAQGLSRKGNNNYHLEYGPGGGVVPAGFSAPGKACRWASSPLLIRLDKAVEPLEPLSAGDWAGEANPAVAGDGRMAQQLDNDAERSCSQNAAGKPHCNSTSANELRGSGVFGATYLSLDSSGDVDTGQPYSGGGDASILSFNVLDDEDEAAWAGPGQKVTLALSPPWEEIRQAMAAAYTAPEWKAGRYAGMMGLGVGWGIKFPVIVGPVQLGVVVITVSIGVSLKLQLEWSADESYPCLNQGGACAALQPSASLKDAMNRCYASGGRLGEMSTLAEAQKVKAVLDASPSSRDLWLGAQVANEYLVPACERSWNPLVCAGGHRSYLRWLTNDENFATAVSFGSATFDTDEIKFPGAAPTPPTVLNIRPVDQGVVLGRTGALSVAPMRDGRQSVCVYDDAASDDSHSFKAGLAIGAAAGVSLAFCTPSDEVGVCLEGSINLVSVGLTPNFSYTYHRLKDSAGRTSVRSNVRFAFDWELRILEGSIDVKVVLGIFEFSYNLFSFDGLQIPKSAAGGSFLETNWPTIEAFR